ncbi:MAG: helix-turn-helix domain-containing protein, partial [Henriciella sp.]
SSEKLNLVLEFYDDARRLPSSQRIAKILLILNRGRPEHTALPFTQADLSAVLGISKVTVNQTLKKLEERGIIETGYRYIRVHNLQQLKQFASAE